MVQLLPGAESVCIYGLNGIAHGIFRFLPGRGGDGRKKGKIIQPRRDPACFRLTLLQPRQHVLRASKDGRRKPGKSRNGKAIATIRWSFRQFMQQDKIALPFPRTDMVKRARTKFFGETSEEHTSELQ